MPSQWFLVTYTHKATRGLPCIQDERNGRQVIGIVEANSEEEAARQLNLVKSEVTGPQYVWFPAADAEHLAKNTTRLVTKGYMIDKVEALQKPITPTHEYVCRLPPQSFRPTTIGSRLHVVGLSYF